MSLLHFGVAIADDESATGIQTFEAFDDRCFLLLRLEIMQDIRDDDTVIFFEFEIEDIGMSEF